MDFQRDMARGRRAVQAVLNKKKTKLITCWVSEDFRDEVYRKCPNVSEFIRVCLEKMVESNLDKQVTKLYEGVAKEVIKDQEVGTPTTAGE